MGSLEEFESVLKDLVLAKRLSASKMSNLTDITMKSMENDTQLVSTLYRTHKSLPPAAKVSSLYVFDALSRAAKHHVNKHGIPGDVSSTKGNCATFLSKIEGVLEGLFQDMITIGSSEAKEKTKKILDIWVKGSTFPPKILIRLSSLMEGTEKVPEVPTVVDPRIAASQPAITTPPIAALPTAPPAPAMDPQATLLALLAQAAQATTVPVQTSINTGVDTAQLAVLQQLALAQTANNGTPSQPTPPQAHPVMSHPVFTPSYREETSYNSHKDPRLNVPQSSDRVNPYDDQPEDRSSCRGGYRGGFRGRGRGRWDERDRDRFRERDGRSSPRRIRRSRSRSPPKHGVWRDVRPYSPPHRSNLASSESHGHGSTKSKSPSENDRKDEFGRDIRPQSPESDKTPSKSDISRSPRPSSPVSTFPPAPTPTASQIASEPVVDPTPSPTSNHDRMSLSPLIAANTSSSIRSASNVSSTASTQPGLENFDPMTFDFTSPASWEALGKMWHITKGYLPSTEELSQFVLTSGQAAFGSMIQTQKWQSMPNSQAWRGGGRGSGFSRGRGGFFHNNVRNAQEEWGEYEANNGTDAIVLGGGSAVEETGVQEDSSTDQVGGAGGKMQRVGDKWLFVREPVST
ncbi:Rpb7-binding protein seb1 [Termitomyces sp. T112]|nr:Rpb7-binding protein seb1 [Termitomyces sp. T112]